MGYVLQNSPANTFWLIMSSRCHSLISSHKCDGMTETKSLLWGRNVRVLINYSGQKIRQFSDYLNLTIFIDYGSGRETWHIITCPFYFSANSARGLTSTEQNKNFGAVTNLMILRKRLMDARSKKYLISDIIQL